MEGSRVIQENMKHIQTCLSGIAAKPGPLATSQYLNPASWASVFQGHLIVQITHHLHLVDEAILEEAAKDHDRQPARILAWHMGVTENVG